MEDGEIVGQLPRLGLTSYEAKAYLSLIKRDSYTAAQGAPPAALPRPRIYAARGTLVQKGPAVARPGTVVKYAAPPPEIAINMLVQAHRQQLLELEQGARSMV